MSLMTLYSQDKYIHYIIHIVSSIWILNLKSVLLDCVKKDNTNLNNKSQHLYTKSNQIKSRKILKCLELPLLSDHQQHT